jgi:hypothetical protein
MGRVINYAFVVTFRACFAVGIYDHIEGIFHALYLLVIGIIVVT